MWSYFSRDPLAGFNYELLAENTYIADKTIWKILDGKKKSSGAEPVTLFLAELKGSPADKIEQFKACFRSFKTFRHPNLLAFIDGTETSEKLCFATEPVIPLSQYVMNNDISLEEVTLGLHQVCTGLEFVIQRCGLIHNNVNWHTIFVTKSGEWKLGGFEFIVKKETESFPLKLAALQVYDPPERARGGVNKRAIHATDSWGLGCLLWEVFNGPLPRPQAVKQSGKIPEALVGVFSSLINTNPSSRLSPWSVIEQSLLPGGCMNNLLVKSSIFLDEIQIKNVEEKRYFFQSLHEKLELFPKQYAIHKLLPILLDTVTNNLSFGSIILPSLMKLGEYMEAADYETQIVPVVVKLFSSPDRQTRMSLLVKIDCYIEHVKSSTVNNDIYPHIIQGFMDTNPTVREQTVKAMLFVAPKLNSKNLNEDLMRHFARIQAKDEQAGIRTNTTVCVGKLACYMDPGTRQKILPAACGRAMRDPFPPSRISGIMAITANMKYFSIADTATKCLPSISPLLADPEKPVRDQAFKAVNIILKRLEEVHQHPEKKDEFENEMNKTMSHSKDIFKSFTGWVLSSWGGSSESTSTSASASGASNATSSAMNGSVGKSSAKAPLKKNESSSDLGGSGSGSKLTVPSPAQSRSISPSSSDIGGGWEDAGAISDNDFTPSSKPRPGTKVSKHKKKPSKDSIGWGDAEDDDVDLDKDDEDAWEDFDKPVNSSTKPKPFQHNPDKFFDDMLPVDSPVKAQPPARASQFESPPRKLSESKPVKPMATKQQIDNSVFSSSSTPSTEARKLSSGLKLGATTNNTPSKKGPDFLSDLESVSLSQKQTNAKSNVSRVSARKDEGSASSGGDGGGGGGWDTWGQW